MPLDRRQTEDGLECSFCGKAFRDVDTLIQGPGVTICSHCVQACEMALSQHINNRLITFRGLNRQPEAGLCFCMAPDDGWFDDVYDAAIKPAVTGLELRLVRGDRIYVDQDPPEGIWYWLERGEVFIADVSDGDPNVLYALGMYVALQLPVLILTQDEDDVPYDARHFRRAVYRNTPDGREALRKEIQNWLTYLRIGES